MPGLYVHIPFCVRKCLYCDFYSVETLSGPPSQRLQRAPPRQPDFLKAVDTELSALPSDFRPQTIFIGGGTPTELEENDLELLLDILACRVDLSEVEEWTCEANPGTLTERKIDILLSAGVNRFSLGVQSFHTPTLEFLGRIHTAEEAVAAYRLLRAKGAKNINIDLIYGVPGQSLDDVQQDLSRLIALHPDHIACYCLTFEEGTPLDDLRKRGAIQAIEDDEAALQYDLVRTMLRSAGYRHYELSNFARGGCECRHNLLYWTGGEYIGVGPSAHSHWNGERYANVRSLREYIQRLRAGKSPVVYRERLDPESKARETLAMSLRMVDGVDADWFSRTTGFDYRRLCGSAVERLTGDGLLVESCGRLRLADHALFVSNAVLAELI